MPATKSRRRKDSRSQLLKVNGENKYNRENATEKSKLVALILSQKGARCIDNLNYLMDRTGISIL